MTGTRESGNVALKKPRFWNMQRKSSCHLGVLLTSEIAEQWASRHPRFSRPYHVALWPLWWWSIFVTLGRNENPISKCLLLDYARNFGNAAREGLKRTTHWAAIYFTNLTSWYPVPERAMSLLVGHACFTTIASCTNDTTVHAHVWCCSTSALCQTRDNNRHLKQQTSPAWRRQPETWHFFPDYTAHVPNVVTWRCPEVHSRPQRPRSFWSAPRITTSGLVQHRKSAIHGLPVTLRMFSVKSDKSDWFWSQSIVFSKPFKNGMSLDRARGRDSWCWPKGARPLGTRMPWSRERENVGFPVATKTWVLRSLYGLLLCYFRAEPR